MALWELLCYRLQRASRPDHRQLQASTSTVLPPQFHSC